MKSVFINTSGFYAFLDRDDRFHADAKWLFLQAESEGWMLLTSNYVVHESWALIQAKALVKLLVPERIQKEQQILKSFTPSA